MRKILQASLLAIVTAGSLLAAPPAHAQSDAEYLSGINFRFSNPGARARGLGGAFVALADDSTAAVVNPAGLTYLSKSEFSLQFERDQDAAPSPRLETGLAISGNNVVPAHAPRRRTFETEDEALSFGSWIFPVKKSGDRHLVLGFFYAKPLDTSSQGESGRTIELEASYFPPLDSVFFPVSSYVAAKNEVVGVSAAFRLGDRFSLGGSLGVSRFDFYGRAERRDFFTPVEVNTQTSLVDQEDDLFATVGGLWRITDKVILGGSWQMQTQYDLANSLTSGSTVQRRFETKFTIPTRWTLGIAFKPTANWVIAAEVDRIEYSDLVADSETFFGAASNDPSYGYAVDDVDELHLGAEYSFPVGRFTLSFRAGAWRDHTHPSYFIGSDPARLARAPRLEEDIYHYTAGIGLDAGGLVVDLAVDHSEDAGDDLLASLVFRPGQFGR